MKASARQQRLRTRGLSPGRSHFALTGLFMTGTMFHLLGVRAETVAVTATALAIQGGWIIADVLRLRHLTRCVPTILEAVSRSSRTDDIHLVVPEVLELEKARQTNRALAETRPPTSVPATQLQHQTKGSAVTTTYR